MAFVARPGEGQQRIWIRSLDKFDAAPLAGTEGAERLFWSPDGRKLGFFADRKLMIIDADGGPTLSLASVTDSRGGTWNREGTIIFASNWNAGLSRVSASGGSVEVLTTLDVASEECTHRYPYFLPDGRHFLYLSRKAGVGPGAEPAIVLASLDATEKRTILNTASSIAYASGHILFARQQTLMAVQFDVERLAVVGDAFPIADDLLVDERYSLAIFSVSQNGTIAYQTGVASSLGQLTWIDRSGKQGGLIGEPENYQNLSGPELSPDDAKVLFSIRDIETGLEDVWIRDLARDMQVRFTFGHVDGKLVSSYGAIWSPDGTHVVHGTLSGRHCYLIRKPAFGTGVAETLLDGPGIFFLDTDTGAAEGWIAPVRDRREFELWGMSADGRLVLYGCMDRLSNGEVGCRRDWPDQALARPALRALKPVHTSPFSSSVAVPAPEDVPFLSDILWAEGGAPYLIQVIDLQYNNLWC